MLNHSRSAHRGRGLDRGSTWGVVQQSLLTEDLCRRRGGLSRDVQAKLS